MTESFDYRVVGPAGDPRAVEAWSLSRRLQLPKKGDAEVTAPMRAELRAALAQLSAAPGEILDAVLFSPELPDDQAWDTENVLIYNAGASCFAGCTWRGARFERRRALPVKQHP